MRERQRERQRDEEKKCRSKYPDPKKLKKEPYLSD
jgi:hypothetical protein